MLKLAPIRYYGDTRTYQCKTRRRSRLHASAIVLNFPRFKLKQQDWHCALWYMDEELGFIRMQNSTVISLQGFKAISTLTAWTTRAGSYNQRVATTGHAG
jgi:hypothetical protein